VRRIRTHRPVRLALAGGAAALVGLPALATSASAAPSPALPIISPAPFAAAGTGQSLPDDITILGEHVFVTYQNGVGPDGAPSATGVTTSSVVEYDSSTHAVVRTVLVPGRVDGLTADRFINRVFATVNEDNNSSLYLINPASSTPTKYTYNPNPSQKAPGATTGNGGTDSVSIGADGTVFVAHSNPDPGFPATPATYIVTLDQATKKANLAPLFRVNARAKDVVTGSTVTLALTDPDSNRFIPTAAPVLPGRLLQVAQADSQLVIVDSPGANQGQGGGGGGGNQTLQRLNLTNAENPTLKPTIDDVTEITGPGTLYVVDQKAGTVQTIDTTNFPKGSLVVAQPADSGNTGQLGILDPKTGVITHFPDTFVSPKGLVFVSDVPDGPPPATPEAPMVVLLPLAGLAVGGGVVIMRRRPTRLA